MQCDRCEAYDEALDEKQHCVSCAIIVRENARETFMEVRRVPRFTTNTPDDRALRDQAALRLRPLPDALFVEGNADGRSDPTTLSGWKEKSGRKLENDYPTKKEITTVIKRETAHRIATRIFGFVDKEKVADIIMQEISTALNHQVPLYTLREANLARQAEWDAGAQLTPTYRCTELAGEIGEACNIVKKLERERMGIRGSRATVEALGEELADGVICLDLLAMTYGINLLGREVPRKFNATSAANNLRTRMLEPF